MARELDIEERELVARINRGDQDAFEQMFRAYFEPLCRYSLGYLDSSEDAREVVQDVFLSIWERRESWEIHSSLNAYLYRAVRNRSLNRLDKEERFEPLEEVMRPGEELRHGDESDAEVESNSLADLVWSAIDELSERRRTAFVLHRQHGLSYDVIGDIMGISPNTVENHIAAALKEIDEAIPDDAFP